MRLSTFNGTAAIWNPVIKSIPQHFVHALKVFVNNTNLTFLTFLYKISIELSLKTKVAPVGLKLTTLTITG